MRTCRRQLRMTSLVCAQTLLVCRCSTFIGATGELLICGGRSRNSSSSLCDVATLNLRTLSGDVLWAPLVVDDLFAWGALHAVPFPSDSSISEPHTRSVTASLDTRMVFIGSPELHVASESQLISPSASSITSSQDNTITDSAAGGAVSDGAAPSPSGTPTTASQMAAQSVVMALEFDQRSHTWRSLLPVAFAGGLVEGPQAGAGAPAGGDPIRLTAPIAREHACSAAIRKRVFLFGGLARGAQLAAIPLDAPWALRTRDGSCLLNDMWVLNVEKERWKVYSCTGCPPSPRFGAAMEMQAKTLS
jgi:hypothetical protein